MILSNPFGHVKGPQGTQSFANGLSIRQYGFEFAMNGRLIEVSRNGAVVKNGTGLTNIPVVGMSLHLNQFDITKLFQIEGFGTLHSFGHDPIDPSGIGEFDLTSTNILIVPIQNVDSSIWTGLHTESDPGQIICEQKVIPMLTNEARTLWHHVVDQNRMFMNIAHEKLIPIFFGKNISQIEPGSAMSRFVGMIPDSLYVIIYERVYILFALLVINAALYHMKEMWNHTTSSKSLPHVIEIKTPGVG